ncbi:unnamed protein product [Eruca vesicaria subsp. sativa]|uniref:Uncharacterized protein n=1 Tax=Eruca vesicaria subsp. sativa TaxID=29727 RepID=A0ABC8KZ71_ERUVS|nr:unnamed protein product [Eruca vesicaria subsp. sativa]
MKLLGTPCGSTPTTSNWRDKMEASEQAQERMGRIGLECETEGYSGGSGSGSVSPAASLLGLFFLLFIIFGVAAAIWCACVQRQKAINAANINNFSGAQVAHGTDLNTVHKGDPGCKV